jgi:dTDP-4-dehydrorhamnose reductase
MRVVVTGAAGQVGRELVEHLDGAIGLDRTECDVASLDAVRAMVARHRPDIVIHCAAYTDVDGCEADPERAMRVNGMGPYNLARATDAYIVALSTDYVFDGTKETPYVESDAPNPISVYGRSKLAGERALDLDRHAIVRTSLVCGVYGRNLVKTILRLAREGRPLRFVADQRGTPTVVHDLVPLLARIAAERRTGVWHVANQGPASPYELAREVLKAAGDDVARVEPITAAELGRPARRPANGVLASERLRADELLPDFRASLPRLLANLRD